MKTQPITSLLAQMTDGYCRWQENDRRRRKHHNTAVAVLSILLAVAVNTAAFAFPVRYSSFDGCYGPDVVSVVDQMIQHQ